MTDAERQRQEHRKNMMLVDPLPRVITKMAVPSIISFLITSIYNLADTYFVSSLGTEATAAVRVNGQAPALTAYNLGGSNYFKLRDLGQALGFQVQWDEATRTVQILTAAS